MSGQDKYHGPKTDAKHLATMSDIWELSEIIENLGQVDGMICWPSNDQGAKLNNPNGVSTFTLTHPAMTCKDVCVYDDVLNQWTSVQVNDISQQQTQLVFGSAPQTSRFCVFIRGVPVTTEP